MNNADSQEGARMSENKQGMKIELQINHYAQENNYDFEIWVLVPQKPPIVYRSNETYVSKEDAIKEGELSLKDMTDDLYENFSIRFHDGYKIDDGQIK